MTEADRRASSDARPATGRANVLVALALLVVTLFAFLARYRSTHDQSEAGESARARLDLAAALRLTRPRWAEQVRDACTRPGCDCIERAAARGLDANLASQVLALLAASAQDCDARPWFTGMKAEALMRNGQSEAANVEAHRALASTPSEPYALYANALSTWRAQKPSEAAALARRSADAGRGSAAELLFGLIAYGENQLDVAEAAFRKVLAAEGDDVEATYDLALVHQRKDQYLAAREGYLTVLRLEPKHVNARYNLALLTHSIGADAEAKHHLERLRQAGAAPEQIAAVEAALAVPAQNARPSASSRNFSLLLGAAPTAPPTSAEQ